MVMSGGMANAFLPIQAKTLDPSGILVGFVVSSYHSIRIFFEIPSGIVSDILGRRKLIILGLAIGAGGAVVCAHATSTYMLIFGRAIWGFGAALFFLNNTASIMNMFEPSMRGKALGIFQSLEIVGNVFGQPVGAFIAERLGFSAAYYVSAIMIGMGLIPMFVSKDFLRQAIISSDNKVSVERREFSKMFKNHYLLILCITVFIRMLINRGITGTIFEIYLVEYLVVSLSMVGIALMIRSACFSITTFGSGVLVDHFGSKPVIISGTILEASAMILYTFVRSFNTIIPIIVLDGLGSGMLSVSLMVTLSNQVDPKQTGEAVGFYRTFQDAGAVSGPVIVMAISDAWNIYSGFYFAALALVSNIPLLMRLPNSTTMHRKKRHTR
jgi:MFS family permease